MPRRMMLIDTLIKSFKFLDLKPSNIISFLFYFNPNKCKSFEVRNIHILSSLFSKPPLDRFLVLRYKRPDRQDVQMPDLEGQDGILRRADDRFLMYVEACVDDAGDPCLFIVCLNDFIIARVVFL